MKLITAALTTLSLLVVLFLATDPNHLPSPLLIAPFCLIFIFLALSTTLLLRLTGMYPQRRKVIALVCAAIPTLLLVLQSIGQLTVRDVLIMTAIIVLSYFYISRLMTAA